MRDKDKIEIACNYVTFFFKSRIKIDLLRESEESAKEYKGF